MELILKIGPYTLSRRTAYSNIRVFEKDIDISSSDTAKTIVKEYLEQTERPNKYFEIEEGKLNKFYSKEGTKYVFLPDGIDTIGEQAFENTEIKFIHMPNSVLDIMSGAFKNCEKLEEINLEKIRWIGSFAFDRCKSLKNIKLSSKIHKITPFCFRGCESLQKINFPCGIEEIYDFSFANCTSLNKINIPIELDYIGNLSFKNSGVKTVVFDGNLTYNFTWRYINDFLKETKIEKIEISKNIKHIKRRFFKGIEKNIKEIDYLGTEEEFKKFKKSNRWFFIALRHATIKTKET